MFIFPSKSIYDVAINIPSTIGINFTGYVEPFLNPEATDMIIHSFKKGHELLLNTTLMGMKIEDWNRIKDSGSGHLKVT